MTRDILLQICQVLAVLALSPLLQGVIVQFEERVQLAQGPGIFQPYRDLWKLFHKQIIVPETASWIYWLAPFVAFTAMMTVPILIRVLTDFPLPLSDMGDILGGGRAGLVWRPRPGSRTRLDDRAYLLQRLAGGPSTASSIGLRRRRKRKCKRTAISSSGWCSLTRWRRSSARIFSRR
jgi:hypothetical protein